MTSISTEQLVERLQSLASQIEELLTISDSSDLSLSVAHHDKIIHTAHFDWRGITAEHCCASNDNTIYRVTSFSKPLTIDATACLVSESILDQSASICKYILEFEQRRDEANQKATLIDLLSNRADLASVNALWSQKNEVFLMSKNEIIRTACFLDLVKSFQSSFVYENWTYDLISEIIKRATTKSFDAFVKEKLLDSLNMHRTTFDMLENENITSPHVVRNNEIACTLSFFNYSNSTEMTDDDAEKSTINDLLLMYKFMIFAHNHQRKIGLKSTSKSLFTQLSTVFSPHITLNSFTTAKQAYCLELYKTRLSENVEIVSINSAFLGNNYRPSTDHSCSDLKVFHHGANLFKCLESSFLVPLSETVIVVLTNATSLSNLTDCVEQLILSIILDEESYNDFVNMFKVVRQVMLGSCLKLKAQLSEGKITKLSRHSLIAYENDYWNFAKNFVLLIDARHDSLLMTAQKCACVTYQLLLYDEDTFYWSANRKKKLCDESMSLFLSSDWHKINFRTNFTGTMKSLIWDHDSMTKAKVFHKRNKFNDWEYVKLWVRLCDCLASFR